MNVHKAMEDYTLQATFIKDSATSEKEKASKWGKVGQPHANMDVYQK